MLDVGGSDDLGKYTDAGIQDRVTIIKLESSGWKIRSG